MYLRYTLLFATLLLVLPLSSRAQRFTHLTTEDGLPSNGITGVVEDDEGYLWIATISGGVVRYDGYEMKEYRHVAGDPTSLSSDQVRSMYVDGEGTVWVGTVGSGLNRLDPLTETFKSYQHREGDPTSLSHNTVRAILDSQDGTLWVRTEEGGLDRFDPATETFRVYRHDPGDLTSLSHDWVRSLLKTRDGTLWIGTGNGLNRLQPGPTPDAVSFTRFTKETSGLDGFAIVSLGRTDIHFGRPLWLDFGPLGVAFIARCAASRSKSALRGPKSTSKSLLHSDCQYALVEDAEGQLWLGQKNGRLARFNPETEQVRYWGSTPRSIATLMHS